VDAFVRDPHNHHTLGSLLRETGVGRKTFAREAEHGGFVPPLRFLQVVRVLGATLVLHHGHTTEQTAEYLGYASGETMRHHFLSLFGATPRVARMVTASEVAERIRERVVMDSMLGRSGTLADGQLRLPLSLSRSAAREIPEQVLATSLSDRQSS
jgi:AraC-like DNA-binding protein